MNLETQINIAWSGDQELINLLRSLPDRIQHRALVAGLRKAGTLLLRTARSVVRTESGTLKRSLGSNVSNKLGQPVVLTVGPRRGFGRRVVVGRKGRMRAMRKKDARRNSRRRIPTQYAHLIEKGHGGKHPSKAYPFLRPAMEQNVAGVREILVSEINRQIEKLNTKEAT